MRRKNEIGKKKYRKYSFQGCVIVVLAVLCAVSCKNDTSEVDVNMARDLRIEVVGVYPVQAPERCHLVELLVHKADVEFDIGSITQEVRGQPKENWQVPWDEHFLEHDKERVINSENPDSPPAQTKFRVVFFFHHLKLSLPLKTALGDIDLPAPSAMPERLEYIQYEQP